MGWELEDVEKPFVAQLEGLGWVHVEGSLDDPKVTGRGSFSEVIQEGVLRERLRALNPGPDGQPWLDDARLSEAVSAITRLGTHKLMEANQEATELLLKGVAVEGLPGWDGGRAQTAHFIDWGNVENNSFVAVSQFKVDCPGGQAKGSIRPDITLFVNGIPVATAELRHRRPRCALSERSCHALENRQAERKCRGPPRCRGPGGHPVPRARHSRRLRRSSCRDRRHRRRHHRRHSGDALRDRSAAPAAG